MSSNVVLPFGGSLGLRARVERRTGAGGGSPCGTSSRPRASPRRRVCYLLLKKHKTRKECAKLVPRFLRAIVDLRQSGLAHLVTLGDTLHSWREEIARMWRFTRSNGITEGFHNKMETINRQAYGYRSFENYRQRVLVVCA